MGTFLHQRSPQRGPAAPPLCGAPRSAASSGGGISALRLVQSVHSCAMLATSIFFLKTKVLCLAAAHGIFFRPKNGPGPEKVERLSAKIRISSKHVHFMVCFEGELNVHRYLQGSCMRRNPAYLPVAHTIPPGPQINMFGEKYGTRRVTRERDGLKLDMAADVADRQSSRATDLGPAPSCNRSVHVRIMNDTYSLTLVRVFVCVNEIWVYLCTISYNPPAPACQGPPGCGDRI